MGRCPPGRLHGQERNQVSQAKPFSIFYFYFLICINNFNFVKGEPLLAPKVFNNHYFWPNDSYFFSYILCIVLSALFYFLLLIIIDLALYPSLKTPRFGFQVNEYDLFLFQSLE